MDLLELARSLWGYLSSFAGKEVGAVIATAIFYLVVIILKAAWDGIKWLYDYHLRLARVRDNIKRTEGPPKREGKGIWVAQPINKVDPPLNAHLTPRIVAIANAKGGVGKTTVAANIAACLSNWAPRQGWDPILLIDLDFQGTLSAMSIAGQSAWQPINNCDSDATYLLSGDWSKQQVSAIAKCATSIGLHANIQTTQPTAHHHLKLLTSYYDLAQAENRIMIDWLIGDSKKDVRFDLKKLLWSNEVLSQYSLIIIDCPPRFTTAAIQAFAAATHILIPTKIDKPSRDAVISFARQIEILRTAKICSEQLQYLGVVATMVHPLANLDSFTKPLHLQLNQPFSNGGVDGNLRHIGENTDIHLNRIFREVGGRGIAYYAMGNAQGFHGTKTEIEKLSLHVARQVNLPLHANVGAQ